MHLGIAFWEAFGEFFAGKWRHARTDIASKIDTNFEERGFEKALFSNGKTTTVKAHGIEVGSKRR